MTTTMTAMRDGLDEIRKLVDEAILRLGQAQTRLDQLLGTTPALPALSAKELARVEAVGEVAYRHWAFIQEHDTMTLGESLAIRRELYGDKVRSTANLFGRKGSGALLHRDTRYGTKRADDQTIRLTPEGERIAKLWKQLHP